MSYTLEESIATVESSRDIKTKLSRIKDIGYRSGLEKLSEYSTTRLKELKLVTSAFSRPIRLELALDYTNGVKALFMIMVRQIKARIPYLAVTGSDVISSRYSDLFLKVSNTPEVNRYIRIYGRKLRDATNSTAQITLSRIDTTTGTQVLTLTIGTSSSRRPADTYLVLKYLEEILRGIETLHRKALLNEASLSDYVFEYSPEEQPSQPDTVTFNTQASVDSNDLDEAILEVLEDTNNDWVLHTTAE